jgi:hypothetical protein
MRRRYGPHPHLFMRHTICQPVADGHSILKSRCRFAVAGWAATLGSPACPCSRIPPDVCPREISFGRFLPERWRSQGRRPARVQLGFEVAKRYPSALARCMQRGVVKYDPSGVRRQPVNGAVSSAAQAADDEQGPGGPNSVHVQAISKPKTKTAWLAPMAPRFQIPPRSKPHTHVLGVVR